MGVQRGRDDAFGHALLDHLQGRAVHPVIIERDDGLVETDSGLAAYFDAFPRWGRLDRAAMRFVRGRVLDVGCGAGRIALHLQTKGLTAVGIDISALAARVCRIRGLESAKALPVTAIGPRLGRFDTIVMMGNNIGLFADRERARWLLRRFRAITSEHGRIVGSSLDPTVSDDPDHWAYHRWNRQRGRMPGQVRLRVRYRAFATPWFDYLFLSPGELEDLADGTGWRVDRIVGNADPGYVAVLEREPSLRAAA